MCLHSANCKEIEGKMVYEKFHCQRFCEAVRLQNYDNNDKYFGSYAFSEVSDPGGEWNLLSIAVGRKSGKFNFYVGISK